MTGREAVTVRDAAAGERVAIRELTLAAYREYSEVMTPSAWAGLEGAVRAALETGDEAEWIVAVAEDGSLVGSVMLYPASADPYGGAAGRLAWPELRLLAVRPDGRGRGVGQALVDECVRRARRAGAPALGLHTSASMGAAIRMYRRMGFVRAPEHDFQPAGAELVTAYVLPLDGSDSPP